MMVWRSNMLLTLVPIFLLLTNCAVTKDRLVSPPLKGVSPQMENCRYWINKVTAPQRVLLTPQEIDFRNRLLIERKDLYMNDLHNFPDFLSREQIEEMLEVCKNTLQSSFYTHLNHPIDEQKRGEILSCLNLDNIPSIKKVQWALTLRECNIRALPTNEIAMEETNNYQFNRFQVTKINPGEALAVIHSSPHGGWYFVASYFIKGWIESQDIALTNDKELVMDFCKAIPFVIYTGNYGYLYYDKELTRFALKVRMGTRFPLIEEGKGYFCVRMPFKSKEGHLSFTEGYLAKDSCINIGYLSFTQENIAKLAFELKGEEYGWGGMFEGRDCSRFIFDIFKCMDVLLPRNSTSQSKAGFSSIDLANLSVKQKERVIIERGIPFATLLSLPGHIMLYLGKEQDRAYIIHSLWAYEERVFFKDRQRKVARVVVSDLYLGKGSKKGSLLERLSTMVFLVRR